MLISKGDYANALTAYKYAEPEVFAGILKLRIWFYSYLTQAIFWLIGLWVVQTGLKRLDNRYKWFDPLRRWANHLQNIKPVDDLVFMFRFIRYPADSFYYIKKDLRGSLKFAGLIYAWVIVVRVLSLYVTGFPFSAYPSLAYIPVENEIVNTVLVLALWNAANYLVSTISDGEGRVRDVIMAVFIVYLHVLLALPIALISNVLTLNEIFVYSFSLNLMWVWIGIMFFIMVKEIHNYSFSETVRNVLITLFTMALFVLTGYILYVLFNQLFDFISAILQEVRLRG
jgi:hypothetical protein